jgi:hypothetical protein
MQYGEEPALQRDHLLRMLRACPWDPKNVAKAGMWLLR